MTRALLSTGRVLAGQITVKFAVYASLAAMTSVLLPVFVAELDPAGKVASLAAITTAGFVMNAVAQPTIGALSDRTRGRFGRRLPWLAVGALLGCAALLLIPHAPTLLALGVLWLALQLGLHGADVAVDAYLVDAFAPERRGTVAGVVGLALVTGTSIGALLAGNLADRPSAATGILAGGVVAAGIAFAVLVRDAAPGPVARRRRRLPDAVRTLAATVASHPDYLSILLWRVGYGIAYGTVFAFLLYLVTDLIGIPALEAAKTVGLMSLAAGGTTAACVVGGGWLSDRVGRRKPFLLLSSAVIVLADLLLLASPTLPTALVSAALFGGGLGLAISCGRALASQLIPDQQGAAAAGLGFLSTAANVGQGAAPVIGAFAIGLGGYPAVFVVSIAGALACSVAVLFIRSAR